MRLGASACGFARTKLRIQWKALNSELRWQWSKSRDRWSTVTVNNVFSKFQAIRKDFEKIAERSRDSGRRSRDRWPSVKQRFWTFQAIMKPYEKNHWTVTRQWPEVTWPSADCQTTFLDVSSNQEKFWKKSLNGHATVVGGHATVGRLSNNVFGRFKQSGNCFEKSHWTVTRQWSEVTRPSADCQTMFLDVSKQLRKFFVKNCWTVTRQWSEVTRPSADCQATFFGRFKQLGKFLKKVTERSRDSGRRSRDRWTTVKQSFLDVLSN